MSSLDDFFAKKDRKKSATKTNLLAADELYRTLEETAKASQEVASSEKQQVEQPANSQATTLEFGIRFSDDAADEDEWCNFTDEHDQPFSGLRRHSKLRLRPGCGGPVPPAVTKEVKLAAEVCPYQDTGGDGLGVGPVSDAPNKPTCPWVKKEPGEVTSSGAKAHDPAAKPQFQSQKKSLSLSWSSSKSPSSTQPQTKSSKKQVYVPPALRQSQSEASSRIPKPSPPSKLTKGQAPDLNNVDFFPSLCQSRLLKRAK